MARRKGARKTHKTTVSVSHGKVRVSHKTSGK